MSVVCYCYDNYLTWYNEWGVGWSNSVHVCASVVGLLLRLGG